MVPNDRISLLTARRHIIAPHKNTLEVFNTAYDHVMFASRKADEQAEACELFAANEDLSRAQAQARRPDYGGISTAVVSVSEFADGDDVYRYAHRVLGSLIPAPMPNFAKRIRAVHEREGRPVRILSLCSGAAGIERQPIASAGCPVEITLLPISTRI